MEQRHSQGLRDQRQEFREALALVQQTVSDTQAGFAGKLASLSVPQCDVSIKMFDDVEGRVEGNERDSHSLQTRMGNLEWNLENLFKSFTSFQQTSDGRVGEVIVSYNKLAKDYNKLASEHDGLHREVAERYADLQQELKMAVRAPLPTSGKARAASSSSKRGKRSGAFQGNATNGTGEPITDEQRRELTAISRAAGVVMYVIANSNVLNIGGGCNVEDNLVVQGDATFQGNLEIKGDLTVRGKIYAASSVDYSPPTPVPTRAPTPVPTLCLLYTSPSPRD